MENATNPEMAVYFAFRDARGFCWPFILLALSMNALGTCGIVLNAGVIWTTWRNRNALSGTANFLLALYSLFEVLHQSGNFVFLWTTSLHFGGTPFIQFQLALRLCSHSLFGALGGQVALAFIALDRLLVVLFPFGAEKWLRPRPYLAAVTLFCCAVSALWVSLLHAVAAQMPEWPVTGCLGLLFPGRGQLIIKCLFVLFFTTTVLYAALWAAIRCRKATGESENTLQERNRRIFRSIMCILCVNMGGYLLFGSIFLCFVSLFPDSPLAEWFSLVPGGILLNASAASNGPILYWTSEEYRGAFQREMARLRKMLCCCSSQQVHPAHNNS